MDGVDGTVKNLVFRAVSPEKKSVKNNRRVCQCCEFIFIKTPYIEVFKMFHDKEPYFTLYCINDKDPLVCGHKAENLDENTRSAYFSNLKLNPFAPNAPFLYPLKTSENRKFFGF